MAVWIALGSVVIALGVVFLALNAKTDEDDQ